MVIATPVLQALIFQSQLQVLEIGFIHHANASSIGEQFRPVNANYTFADFLSNVDKNTRMHLIGKCIKNDTVVYNYDMNLTTYQSGALYQYMYVDSSVNTTQRIILSLVSLLGSILLWRLRCRRSGMRAPYADVATLAALATADPTFMRHLSNLMDLNPDRARAWKNYLVKQTVHLGSIHSHGYRSSTRASRTKYGFYFGPSNEEPPRISRSGALQEPGENTLLQIAIIIIGAPLLLIFIVTGINFHKYDALASQGISSLGGTDVGSLVCVALLAIWKDIWKVIEKNIVNFAFTGYWRTKRQGISSSGCRLPFSPSLTKLGRGYVRIPAFWLTVRTLCDTDITLFAVALISICWEVVIVVLVHNVNVHQLRFYCDAMEEHILHDNCNGAIDFDHFLHCWTIYLQESQAYIGPSGGIASLLGLVSNSEELLRAVQPLRHIYNPNERMEYLREVDAAYTCRNVTARHLSGGYTYGIEMVDRRREGHRVR
jgi:hypothetical protein